jgi:hypothetical protein
MPIIRLLHLSDLHLAGFWRAFYESLGNIFPLTVYDLDTFGTLSEIIFNWHKELDAILISGDMAVTGGDDDLLSAKEKLSTLLNQTGFNKPIILLPGNHDRYRTLLGLPGGSNFDQKFSAYWPVGMQGVYSCFLPNKAAPTLAIICADFSLRQVMDSSGLGGHWGQGKVDKDRLQGLVDETETIISSNPDCGIIWMVHFAPKYEDEHLDFDHRLILLDSDYLIEAAKKVGVKYIFCGHTHQHADYLIKVNGGVQIHCAGSSTCLGNDHQATIHLRLIEITDVGIESIRSRTYFYNPDLQIFY